MKAKSKLIPVLSIILAATVLVSAVAYVFVEPFKVAVQTSVQSPEKQMKKTSNNYLTSLANSVFEAFETVEGTMTGEVRNGYKSTITIELGEEYLASQGTDITGLAPIGASVTAMAENGLAWQNYELLYNGSKILDANIYQNTEDGTNYIQLPELSDAYFSASVDELEIFLDSFDISTSGMLDTLQTGVLTENNALLEDFGITQEASIELITRYIEIVFDNVENINRTKNVKGSVDGVDYKYTALEATFTVSDLFNVGEACLREIKTDKEIKEILKSVYAEMEQDECYSEEVGTFDEEYANFQSGVDQLIVELAESREETLTRTMKTEAFSIIEWIDSNNEIVGFEIVVPNNDLMFDSYGEEETDVASDLPYISAGIITVSNDDEYAIEAWMDIQGETMLELIGSAEIASGASTGEFVATFDEDTVILSVDGFKVNSETGSITGSASLSVNADGTSMEFAISGEKNGSADKVSFLAYEDKLLIAKIVVEYEEIPVTKIILPGADEKIYKYEEFDTYLEGLNTDDYLAKLENILGTELYNSIMSEFEDESAIDYSSIVGMTLDEAKDYLISKGINSYDINAVGSGDTVISVDYHVDYFGDTVVDLELNNEVFDEEYEYMQEIQAKLADIKMNVNQTETGFPFSASLLNNLAGTDNPVEPNDWNVVMCMGVYATVQNNTSQTITLDEGVIDYLYFDDEMLESDNWITINGIEVGSSTYQEVCSAFNSEPTYSNVSGYNGTVEVNDYDTLTLLTFHFTNGICSSVDIYSLDYSESNF